MNTPYPTYRADIEVCRTIHARHGKSYYFATRMFPRDLREATHALYAFFRLPDEIVDSHGIAGDAARRMLDRFSERLRLAFAGKSLKGDDIETSVLRVTVHVFARYRIPERYAWEFLAAMRQDLAKSRYATYAELEAYMYGSAAVVGLMMSEVIGYRDPSALAYAKKLGEAMQLTNFLRDIREDLEERDRIYLPAEDLRRFGVSESDLREHRVTPAFRELMHFEIERARRLYAEAEPGIVMLDPRGRFAVRAASHLYAAILGKIEEQGDDIYSRRAKTSFWEKLMILWKLRTQESGS